MKVELLKKYFNKTLFEPVVEFKVTFQFSELELEELVEKSEWDQIVGKEINTQIKNIMDSEVYLKPI
jgi:hypothetical protein